ncbi:hypothetical protein [Streptomyces sp. NPDC056672]|uniref:hypothetical protein n=1 Tax=Streptomyces sp. NPDC056672 TaxID=3345906 RepID=UPI00368CFE57
MPTAPPPPPAGTQSVNARPGPARASGHRGGYSAALGLAAVAGVAGLAALLASPHVGADTTFVVAPATPPPTGLTPR